MNLPHKLPKFLNWLQWARGSSSAPPIVPLKWEELRPEGIATDVEAEAFLYFEEVIDTPESSNVEEIQYFSEAERLIVGFKNTYYYEYFEITLELAYDFYIAVSKGRWVWDNLRTVRRAYNFLYSLNGKEPVRMEDPAATSVKAAQGSMSVLGVDPFSRTKSAQRVKRRYALLSKGLRVMQPSHQFSSIKRHRQGKQSIKALRVTTGGISKIIRGK